MPIQGSNQPFGQDLQISQESGEGNAGILETHEAEQWKYVIKAAAGDSSEQQGLSRWEVWLPHNKTLGILAGVVALIGFVISILSVGLAVTTIKHADTQGSSMLEGITKLAGSMVLMLISVALFAIAVAMIILWRRRERRWARVGM